jgi:hypothetical protein
VVLAIVTFSHCTNLARTIKDISFRSTRFEQQLRVASARFQIPLRCFDIEWKTEKTGSRLVSILVWDSSQVVLVFSRGRLGSTGQNAQTHPLQPYISVCQLFLERVTVALSSIPEEVESRRMIVVGGAVDMTAAEKYPEQESPHVFF